MPCIKPEQVTAYDDASKEVERAAKILEAINLACIYGADALAIAEAIVMVRKLRAHLYGEAHDCFLRERGLKEQP
jgi:hypothetical protein